MIVFKIGKLLKCIGNPNYSEADKIDKNEKIDKLNINHNVEILSLTITDYTVQLFQTFTSKIFIRKCGHLCCLKYLAKFFLVACICKIHVYDS